MPSFPRLPLYLALQAVLFCQYAQAADFSVAAAATDTSAKTLASGNTGTIAATGTLSVSGSTVAVTITGNNATVNNLGSVLQTGTGRAFRDNTGVTALTINNGSASNSSALMLTADGDVIQMNKPSASVTLNNYGTMTSVNASAGGSQAVDFSAIMSGANVVNNYLGGVMQATEADAVRPGVNGVVYNAGTIKATTTLGNSSDGVDVQSNSGVQITNASSGLIQGGRSGVAGGAASAATGTFTTSITNDGTIQGDNGSGINLDGFNASHTATIVNHGTIIGNGVTGDGDGIDVDGPVNVTNTGIIRSVNAYSLLADGVAASEGITVGGGIITNSGTIEGLVAAGNTNAVGVGISLLGNDITTGPLAGTREGIYANSVVTNLAGGLIRGQNDSAIRIKGPSGGFTVVINNNAGATIRGGGATSAAIEVTAYDLAPGNPDVTIVNAGTIDGSSSGKAILLGQGNDTVQLLQGSTVIGSIDGGSGVNILKTSGTQSFASGAISNFQNFQVTGGTTTFNYNLGSIASMQVDTGATLKVNGAVSTTGNLTVNGTLASFGSPRTITVGGNYAQGANSNLQLGVYSNTSADRITVTGAATIADGAGFSPQVNTNVYIANGATYTVVSALGGLTVNPNTLALNYTPSLLTYTLSKVGTDLVLTAQRPSYNTTAPAGLSAFGTALESLGQSGASSALFASLNNLPNATAVKEAIRQLAPETNQSSQQVTQTATGTVFTALENRMDETRSGAQAMAQQTGLSAGDSATRRAWVQSLGTWGEQNQNIDVNGYKVNAYGAAVGLEANRSANQVMGISLAYNEAGVDGTGRAQGDNIRLNAVNLGGYLSQSNPGMTLDASVLLGYNNYKSERLVAFTGFSQTAKGDYSGWQIGARVEAGFPFKVNPVWSGRWLAGARTSYLATDGYTESGNALVTQRVESSNATSFQSVLGTELTKTLSPSSSLQLRARYLHEFANSPDVTAAFVAGGSSFTTNSAEIKREAIQLGLGYRYVTEKGISVNLRYDIEVKDTYLAQQLSARAIWNF